MTMIADFLNSGTPPAQDYIILAGKKSPGRATITGAGSPRTWDKQKGWGFSGATLIYTGDDLSEFDVVIDMWLPEHWAQWNSFAALLEKAPKGVRAKALVIQHPLLNNAPLKITDVVIRDVTQFEQSKSGLWSARIALTAYRAPQRALAKQTATIPGVGDTINPFANDPVIGGLVAKQAALGGVL